MLGRRMAGGPGGGGGGGGVSEQRQREAAFDFHFGGGRRHTHTGSTAAVPSKLFLPAGTTWSSVVVVSGEEAFSPPPPELAAEAVVVMVSPTSTLQAPAASPTTTTAVPFSRRRRATGTSSSSGGDANDPRRSCKSRNQRPSWEARPVGVGLAGALNGDDAVPPAAATTVLTVTTGQRIRPCPQSSASPSALGGSPGRPESRSRCRRQCVLSPREMMEASSEEDYTRVIERGANPRTTHIFADDRVVVVVEEEDDEFLRWCHGCSKDLGQDNDIFMYRGEMNFCSHECRYREMLLFDDQEFNRPADRVADTPAKVAILI